MHTTAAARFVMRWMADEVRLPDRRVTVRVCEHIRDGSSKLQHQRPKRCSIEPGIDSGGLMTARPTRPTRSSIGVAGALAAYALSSVVAIGMSAEGPDGGAWDPKAAAAYLDARTAWWT